MRRLRLILALLACVYVASWFLPAVLGDGSTLEGYWAFWVALAGEADSWVGKIWLRASAVSNAWFLIILALILRSPQRIRMWMFWGVVCCVASNAWWLTGIHSGEDSESIDLAIGYYLWLGSFVGLAIVAWFARRASSARSTN